MSLAELMLRLTVAAGFVALGFGVSVFALRLPYKINAIDNAASIAVFLSGGLIGSLGFMIMALTLTP